MRWKRFLIAFILMLIIIFPLVNVLLTSFKPSNEIFQVKYQFIPSKFTFQWYQEVFVRTPITKNIFNSFIVAIGTMFVNLIVVTTAAFGLSRYTFPFKNTLSKMVIFTYMFPSILLVLPLYLIIGKMGLINKYPGLGIAHLTFTIPYGIWLLKGYMDTIPKSIDECATIDGAGPVRIFLQIIAPLAGPGIASVMTYTLISSWNEYLYASVIMSGQLKTLPVKISEFIMETSEIRWGTVMAAACIALLPVTIIFQFLQKDFIKGLTAGSVKG
ncbi:carbohydrate ABC transporter permease [Breznakiella homolactica]|uniref:Carbohydrate ABC transporter permease n=1 Tax=Breznakiella homolactica TaxID=2798577 RepID=A0A7T7XMD9_9SPIR|nr:carbohydrate ABC transporter permease [Breznakiella homolactica]QQO08887.1 carbohydrate ABC transporter permease [Breznakiella homolactica]